MADKNKHTGKEAAGSASDVLRDGRTSSDSKTSAGSALSQAGKKTNKTTGGKATKKASQVLRDEDTGKDSKKAAGSALSQKKSAKKKQSKNRPTIQKRKSG